MFLRLATAGSSDGAIHLWNLQTGTCSTKLSAHKSRIRHVTFNSTGAWLASASEDFTIKIWELESGRCRLTLQGHENWVWAVAVSHDDRLIASCSLIGRSNCGIATQGNVWAPRAICIQFGRWHSALMGSG